MISRSIIVLIDCSILIAIRFFCQKKEKKNSNKIWLYMCFYGFFHDYIACMIDLVKASKGVDSFDGSITFIISNELPILLSNTSGKFGSIRREAQKLV